ncbi:ribosome small subunit-dependent GTPase A [Smaragdicoccus niigatensis]|uniref:ribosome small subunit-dependent GTPase A n=1 Tax=Smaragdicoccus niigatensis TaxID=359359 RepID=UPI0003625DE9|nr:ribosome small subunit-dependent GTPase A [Smaragdicoccus niigatensis]
MFDLHHYGWDSTWQQLLSGDARAARVITTHRAHARVVSTDGIATLPLSPNDPPLCTGDWLALSDNGHMLLPRRTALTRAVATRQSTSQILAANVDTVVVAFGLDRPVRLNAIERFLTLAWSSGAMPVVALTKADLHDNPSATVTEVASNAPGARVVAVSSIDRSGIADLVAALSGTIAIIGPSGAGKSTLINTLTGTETAETGAVRESDFKGRHTTVSRNLTALADLGLVLIDTPGLRGAGIWNAEEGLNQTFEDIAALAELCHFIDCRHEMEPGCAVREAIAAGTLSDRRLHSYQKLQREDAWLASRIDARTRAEHDKRFKSATKALRQQYRDRGYR